MCKRNVLETSLRQVLVQHDLENAANAANVVFHRSCWIATAITLPNCPICVMNHPGHRRPSCTIWNQSLGRTGAIERMWIFWLKVKFVAFFITAIFPVPSIFVAVVIAVKSDNINWVWMLPMTIILNIIEFILRFLGTAALAGLLVHAFGFSSLLFYPIYFILSLLISYLLLKSAALVTRYL